MFIKLPSGVIFQIEKIVRCDWNEDHDELHLTVGFTGEGRAGIMPDTR